MLMEFHRKRKRMPTKVSVTTTTAEIQMTSPTEHGVIQPIQKYDGNIVLVVSNILFDHILTHLNNLLKPWLTTLSPKKWYMKKCIENSNISYRMLSFKNQWHVILGNSFY